MTAGLMTNLLDRLRSTNEALHAVDGVDDLRRPLVDGLGQMRQACVSLQQRILAAAQPWLEDLATASGSSKGVQDVGSLSDELAEIHRQASQLESECKPDFEGLRACRESQLEDIESVHNAVHQVQGQIRQLDARRESVEQRLRAARARRSTYAWLPDFLSELIDLITGLQSEIEQLDRDVDRLKERLGRLSALARATAELSSKTSGVAVLTSDLENGISILAGELSAITGDGSAGDTNAVLLRVLTAKAHDDVRTLIADAS